jgi:hypothetical protein
VVLEGIEKVEEFVADPLAVAAAAETGRHQDFSLLKSVQGYDFDWTNQE